MTSDDSTGRHTSDRPVSAEDRESTIRATVDPTGRVLDVAVLAASRVQTPDDLRSALDDALRAARAALANGGRAPAPRDPHRELPTAQGPGRREIQSIANWMGTGWRPDPASLRVHAFETRDLSPTQGISDNQCVTVTLDIASTQGAIDVDPGWLRQAEPANIGRALTQAFTDAYRKRDKS